MAFCVHQVLKLAALICVVDQVKCSCKVYKAAIQLRGGVDFVSKLHLCRESG